MDVTLHAHDAKFYPLPQGLKEISSDITREVLRCQPTEIYKFIADYLNAVLLTREKAREAAIIVKDILEHDITYEAMLQRRGISLDLANHAATIIQSAYRGYVQRKLFSNRAWLTAGFNLLAFLQARGLSIEAAHMHATKIQALYRGYVVRRVMRTTFNFAVGRDKRDESGKALEWFLVKEGMSDEDANVVAQNVIYKYSMEAGEFDLTDGETDVEASDTEGPPSSAEGDGDRVEEGDRVEDELATDATKESSSAQKPSAEDSSPEVIQKDSSTARKPSAVPSAEITKKTSITSRKPSAVPSAEVTKKTSSTSRKPSAVSSAEITKKVSSNAAKIIKKESSTAARKSSAEPSPEVIPESSTPPTPPA